MALAGRSGKDFCSTKKLVTEAPGLKYFDPNRPTKISVDASSNGLGAVLLQDNHPIAYASKALTNCQQRYAQIENEMLAVAFGCTRSHEYIYGMSLGEVETDIRSHPKETTTPGSCKASKNDHNHFEIFYWPRLSSWKDVCDRWHIISCVPPREVQWLWCWRIWNQCTADTTIKLAHIKDHVSADPELQQLIHLTSDGWPNDRSKVLSVCSLYWNFRDQITYSDGVVIKGEQTFMPKAMQLEMLNSSHLGIEKCKRRACDIMYWPGMSAHIEDIVFSCATCNTYQRNNLKESLLSHSIPEHPWSKSWCRPFWAVWKAIPYPCWLLFRIFWSWCS